MTKASTSMSNGFGTPVATDSELDIRGLIGTV